MTFLHFYDKKYNPGDIIGSVNFSLYKEENNDRYSEKNNINPHYVYVVSVEDGKVIVSSWGDRFIFDDNDAEQTSKFVLKITNK